jgi:stress-induced-phosphoprotein 1
MSSAEEYKSQGNAAFAKKDYDEAIDLFSKGIALDENNHVLYSNRSASYAGIQVSPKMGFYALASSFHTDPIVFQDFENALRDATKCIQIKPDWGKVRQRPNKQLLRIPSV